MIDFIGIGAQKSGTSWVYACLYEHPEICAPIKEIHFFSRPRYSEGILWYEEHFNKCAEGKLRGEFSTSYLYAEEAAERIQSHYPAVKIIAIVRNPITRAYSQYRNAIKAGEISETMTFEAYQKSESSVLAQGLYAEQLKRYYACFKKEQVLVLVYEDIAKDPVSFMRQIYTFLGVDPSFVSSMVHDQINVARTPKIIVLDRSMHHVSEFLRRIGLDKFVHYIRTLGIPDFIRSFNTKAEKSRAEPDIPYSSLRHYFKNDVQVLSALLGRDLNREWNI